MKKKMISAALLAALVLSSAAFSLAGCGSDDPDSDSEVTSLEAVSESLTVLSDDDSSSASADSEEDAAEETGKEQASEKEEDVEEEEELKLLETGYSIDQSDFGVYVSYAFVVENTTSEKAEFPAVSVTARDKDGAIIATDEMVLFNIMPEDTVAQASMLSCNDRVPEEVEFSVSAKDFTEDDDGIKSSDFKITNTSEIADSYGGVSFTGEIECDQELESYHQAAVTVLLYNGKKLVGGETTYVDNLKKGKSKAFEISVLGTVPEHTDYKIAAQLW